MDVNSKRPRSSVTTGSMLPDRIRPRGISDTSAPRIGSPVDRDTTRPRTDAPASVGEACGRARAGMERGPADPPMVARRTAAAARLMGRWTPESQNRLGSLEQSACRTVALVRETVDGQALAGG